MEVREATLPDIPVLIELRKQQLLDEGLPPLRNIDAELEDYFDHALTNGSFIAWLALENNTVIATSGLCFYQLPPTYSNPSGMVAYVTTMFTAKTYRRRGIASILLEKILHEARTRAFSVVRLHASSDGKNLYEKFGFLPSEGMLVLKL